jgi:hypothetical protein
MIGGTAEHPVSIDKQARQVLFIAALCFLLALGLVTGWLIVITDRVQSLETKWHRSSPCSMPHGSGRSKYELPPGPC